MRTAYIHTSIPESTVSEGILTKDFLMYTAGWATFLSLVHISLSPVIKTLFPKWYNNLAPNKQQEIPSYFVATLHHIVVTPICFFFIVKDILAFNSTGLPFPADHFEIIYTPKGVVTWTLGYFVADLLCFAIPDAIKGNSIFFFHHIFSVILIVGIVLKSQGTLLQTFPHMLITETSGLCFNLAWLLRTYGYRDTLLIRFLEYSFAVYFFLLRIVNINIVAYALLPDMLEHLGYLCHVVVLMLSLQFYWFYKIILSLQKKKKKVSNVNVNTYESNKDK